MADYAHPETIVDTEWASKHLNDPKVRFIEVDVDTAAYEQGHLPGAVGLNWRQQLQDVVRRDVLSKTDFEKLMSQAGVGNDTTVVVYGDNNNWFATWAFWQLRLYGHKDVRVLNGGRTKWLAEKRATTTDAAKVQPTQYRAQEPNAALRAMRDQVVGAVAKKQGVALVDVRSPREYSGELLAPENLPQEGSQRGGHIPGAANIPWAQAVREDGTFKSADDLKALYQGKGVTADKEVFAYCRIGERSSHTWFVLSQLLGYPKVRNYDGSWTEWGSSVGVPIEK